MSRVPLLALAALGALALGCSARRGEPAPPVPSIPPVIEEPTSPAPSEAPDPDRAREAEESVERAGGAPPGAHAEDAEWLREPEVVAEILFASGSAELTAGARSQLDALVGRLAETPGEWRLELEGHADGAGDEVVNRLLAAHRADAVRRYLGDQRGIPLERIGLRSLGESAPVADEATAGGRALNRRVVVLLGRPPA
jgi:outer membrane protein OmpA-like peptidoglycan-associated protein